MTSIAVIRRGAQLFRRALPYTIFFLTTTDTTKIVLINQKNITSAHRFRHTSSFYHGYENTSMEQTHFLNADVSQERALRQLHSRMESRRLLMQALLPRHIRFRYDSPFLDQSASFSTLSLPLLLSLPRGQLSIHYSLSFLMEHTFTNIPAFVLHGFSLGVISPNLANFSTLICFGSAESTLNFIDNLIARWLSDLSLSSPTLTKNQMHPLLSKTLFPGKK